MPLGAKVKKSVVDFRSLLLSLNAKMFGFSLTFTWSFFVFYSSFWNDGALYLDGLSSVFAFSCCVGNILGFVLTWFLNRRRNHLGKSDPLNIAVGAVSVAGMVLAVFSFLVPRAAQLPCMAFGGFLTGVTTSWIVAMWGFFFVSLNLRQRTICALGSVLSGGITYLTLLLFPRWAQLVIVCFILLASWAMANSCNEESAPVQKESADSYVRLKRETGHSVFAMFLFGIFFWVCWTIKMGHATPSASSTAAFIAMYLVLAAIVASAVVVTKRQVSAEVIFRFALPAAMLGVIVIFCLSDRYMNAGFALFMLAYALMDIFLFLVLCNASRRTRCNPVICFGRLFEALSMPLGMLLGMAFLHFNFAIAESTIALGIVFLLAVSIGTIGSQKETQDADPIEGGVESEDAPYVSSALEFAQKCRLAIESYGLSPRETEVMLLITRGRSVPYISEHLYMARSTTKAHVTSIYRKMDVSDRQEMIDLIESIPVE